MAASARPRPARKKPAPQASPEAAADATVQPLDGALVEWSDNAAREFAAWGLGASTAWLRTLEAVQEVQLEAMRDASRLQEDTAAQMTSVHDAAGLLQLQMGLAQSAGELAMRSASRLGELATRQAFDGWKEAADGFSRFQGAAWSSTAHWVEGLARRRGNAELVEAEVEHVVSPLAASPFAWPVQEASRQALTLASEAWNDWLTASNRWAAGFGGSRA